ncbi:MAG: hypothetical protein ACFBZ8_12150 [Opitutales bacterium]
MKPRETITTLCIGQRFLRMGLALMRSILDLAGERYRLVIFHAQAHPALLRIPGAVELLPLDASIGSANERPVKNPHDQLFNEREKVRFKCAPLNDPRVNDDAVLFLDADSLVYRDVLAELFALIHQSEFIVFGDYRDDDFIWLKEKDGDGFSLKDGTRALGKNLPNFSLNSGLIGRAPTATGRLFSKRFEAYTRTRPFADRIRSDWHRLNDEPYLALAFVETAAETGLGTNDLPANAYITTASASIEARANRQPRLLKGDVNAADAAIIHFAGKSQHPVYLEQMEPRAPLSLRGRLHKRLKPASAQTAVAS